MKLWFLISTTRDIRNYTIVADLDGTKLDVNELVKRGWIGITWQSYLTTLVRQHKLWNALFISDPMRQLVVSIPSDLG